MGVGGGVDALAGPLPAVLLLQQGLEDAEGHGGLGGGARLGDDVDGEVLVLHQVDDLQHGVGGQAVAGKVDLRAVLVGQVEVGGVEQLHHRTGPQIGAADADDHQGLGVAADALRRRLDAGELLLVIVPWQVHPAGEVAAGAAAALQLGAALLQPGQAAGQPVLRQKGCRVGNITGKHDCPSSFLRLVLPTVYTNGRQFPRGNLAIRRKKRRAAAAARPVKAVSQSSLIRR